MRGVFGGRGFWAHISKQFRLLQSKPFCNNTKQPTPTTKNNNSNRNGSTADTGDGVADGSNSLTRYDAYKEVENLDFMKAAKILFSDPPKKKKFGLDFHLVQLFFACMPSLAVYLVAQYARYEMRRMEAELEQKKQAEEEAKAKEMELKAAEEAAANPELLLKARLEKLEEAVKELAAESKKKSGGSSEKNNSYTSKQLQPAPTKPNNTHNSKHASSESMTKTSGKAADIASTQRSEDCQSRGASDDKKT